MAANTEGLQFISTTSHFIKVGIFASINYPSRHLAPVHTLPWTSAFLLFAFSRLEVRTGPSGASQNWPAPRWLLKSDWGVWWMRVCKYYVQNAFWCECLCKIACLIWRMIFVCLLFLNDLFHSNMADIVMRVKLTPRCFERVHWPKTGQWTLLIALLFMYFDV